VFLLCSQAHDSDILIFVTVALAEHPTAPSSKLPTLQSFKHDDYALLIVTCSIVNPGGELVPVQGNSCSFRSSGSATSLEEENQGKHHETLPRSFSTCAHYFSCPACQAQAMPRRPFSQVPDIIRGKYGTVTPVVPGQPWSQFLF
jgi:hypothetical protein